MTVTIPLTTVAALRAAVGALDLPDDATVEPGLASGESCLYVEPPPEPTTVDLLREVADHAPYRTAQPDGRVIALSADGNGSLVYLTKAQNVTALNTAPLLLRLVDAYDHHGAIGQLETVDAIVTELRGDR